MIVQMVDRAAVLDEPLLNIDADGDEFILEISDDEDEDEADTPDMGDVNATNGAIKYAKEIGVDLVEMDTGERITKRDVENYARETGLL